MRNLRRGDAGESLSETGVRKRKRTMSKSVEKFTRRGFIANCWDYSKGHWLMLPIMAAAVVWGILSEYGPLLDTPWLQSFIARIPRLPLHWALVIFLSGLVFILIEGGYRAMKQQTMDAADKVEALQAAMASSEKWIALSQEFDAIRSHLLHLEWQESDGARAWRASHEASGHDYLVEPLVIRAGKLLLHTPRIDQLAPSEVLAAMDPVERWALLLMTDGTIEHAGGVGYEMRKGVKVDFTLGEILNAGPRSTAMCLRIAAHVAD